MIDLLILLLRPALQCTDAGSRHPKHVAAAVAAWLLDLVICNTTWKGIAGPRQGSERTISDTLERLCITPGERQQLFIEIAKEINRKSPTGRHIKAVP